MMGGMTAVVVIAVSISSAMMSAVVVVIITAAAAAMPVGLSAVMRAVWILGAVRIIGAGVLLNLRLAGRTERRQVIGIHRLGIGDLLHNINGFPSAAGLPQDSLGIRRFAVFCRVQRINLLAVQQVEGILPGLHDLGGTVLIIRNLREEVIRSAQRPLIGPALLGRLGHWGGVSFGGREVGEGGGGGGRKSRDA